MCRTKSNMERWIGYDIKQLKSVYSEIRSHLVVECHASITRLYSLSQLSKESKRQLIVHLATGDRFIQQQSSHEVSLETRIVHNATCIVRT